MQTSDTPAPAVAASPTNPDLAMPDGLSTAGQQAYAVITAFLAARGIVATGGCTTFYAPSAWQARGEQYGCRSELVVVYDGSAVRRVMSMDACYDACSYEPYEALQNALTAAGFFFEECTNWYSAIYKS